MCVFVCWCISEWMTAIIRHSIFACHLLEKERDHIISLQHPLILLSEVLILTLLSEKCALLIIYLFRSYLWSRHGTIDCIIFQLRNHTFKTSDKQIWLLRIRVTYPVWIEEVALFWMNSNIVWEFLRNRKVRHTIDSYYPIFPIFSAAFLPIFYMCVSYQTSFVMKLFCQAMVSFSLISLTNLTW